MRTLNLTNAQFEHTLGIIGEIDLSPLLAAFGQGGRMVDLVAALPLLGQAREKRILRRLEAIWSADPDTLENAETASDLMVRLEAQTAKKPVAETIEGLVAFFSGLGLSPSGIPGSLAAGMTTSAYKPSAQAQPQPLEPSPSADS